MFSRDTHAHSPSNPTHADIQVTKTRVTVCCYFALEKKYRTALPARFHYAILVKERCLNYREAFRGAVRALTPYPLHDYATEVLAGCN